MGLSTFNVKSELTLAHEVDEAGNHENRVKVKLALGVVSPCERKCFALGMELDNPIKNQSENAMEENLRDEDHETETATSSARHFVVIAFAVPEKRKRIC